MKKIANEFGKQDMPSISLIDRVMKAPSVKKNNIISRRNGRDAILRSLPGYAVRMYDLLKAITVATKEHPYNAICKCYYCEVLRKCDSLVKEIED